MQKILSHLFHRHTGARVILTLLLPITISSGKAQQYTGDGIPSGIEEEIRWLVNRGRFDSAAENATQETAYSDIPATDARGFFRLRLLSYMPIQAKN